MACAGNNRNFITNFSRTIVSRKEKMALLRCEYEDGSQEYIGLRGEAFESLGIDSSKSNPFVVKFFEPIISMEQEMALLRCQYEDGNCGCIGIQGEAFKALLMFLKSFPERKKSIDGTSLDDDNAPTMDLRPALMTQLII
jgi:hypothetical protein